MKLNSLQPFIPSGENFERSKAFFIEFGFEVLWENDGLVGFQKDNCKFILQNLDDKHLAENLMISVNVDDLDEFWEEIDKKELLEKFGIRLGKPKDFAWGREIHMIDLAGVCWHFSAD